MELALLRRELRLQPGDARRKFHEIKEGELIPLLLEQAARLEAEVPATMVDWCVDEAQAGPGAFLCLRGSGGGNWCLQGGIRWCPSDAGGVN